MRKLSIGEWVAAAVAVVFVGYTLFGGNIMNLFKKANTVTMNTNEQQTATVAQAGAVVDLGGVKVQDLVVGTGAEVKSGDKVAAHYLLTLADGTVIQNSKDFGVPFEFTIGAGNVIPGWERGFAGMKVGGVRVITIPPELGYGANQAGPIPPNSTLVFTVELVSTGPATATPTAQPAQ